MSQTNLFEPTSERKLDPVRTARQEEIVKKWKANNGKGTLEAVTGFGKTRTAIMAIEALINSPNAKEQRDVTVIVPSIPLKHDWEEHLKGKPYPSKVYVINTLVNRFTKENPLNTSLLIPDEFHRYHSEVHGTLFDIVNYNFIFGTTATIDPEEEKYSRIKEIAPIIDTVTLEEALANNWVSDFKIFNLGINMSDEEQFQYRKLGKKFNQFFKTFDFDFGLAMDCLSKDSVRKEYAKFIGWEEGAVMTHAAQFSRVVQARKQFLFNSETKLRTAKQIIERFPDKVFITFSESTDFADELNSRLGKKSTVYHSSMPTKIIDKATKQVVAIGVDVDGKIKYKDLITGIPHSWANIKKVHSDKKLQRKGITRLRKESLKKFKEEECRIINTAKALDEGINVPKINASIVTSGSGKTRQSIQRLGRSIRQIPGKVAFQVEIYLRNTQDEVWLRNRQEESTNINWIDNIDEIII